MRARSISARLGEFHLGPIDFEAPTASVTALIGTNGCGKTTLLRALCGVQPLLQGEAMVDEINLATLTDSQRAARLAFVAQRPSVPAALTVRETVALGRLRLPHNPQAIDEAMRITGVLQLQHQLFECLSEGQRHRAAVARALAQRSAALAMLAVDEPTASLDPAWSAALAKLMRSLASQKLTVIVATHDFAFAAACCDRAALMQRGRVVASGAFDEVMRTQPLSELFATPFTMVSGLCERPIAMPCW